VETGQEVLEGTQGAEVLNEQALEAEQTETVEPVEDVAESEESQELAEGEEPAEELPYEPDFTYTFKDEKLEFDPKVKELIKTKEDEDYYRDLFTSKKAFEQYKEFGSVRELENKLETYDDYVKSHETLNSINEEIETLGKMIESGNFEQFREYLNINKDDILKWAVNEVKAKEDPQFAQQLQMQRQQEMETFNLQLSNQMMQNNLQEQQIQQYDAELNSTLESNEVAQAYDKLLGTGAFKQAVIDHGSLVAMQTGRNISVAEAVSAVGDRLGGLVANQAGMQQVQETPQQNVAPQPSSPEQTVVIKQQGKNTIPPIRGGSNSPAKKGFKTLADLRAHAKSME
jgi:hypothetical protein